MTTRHGHDKTSGGVGGVGATVRRHGDDALLTGRAAFIDDISPSGVLHVAMVRSPFPHAMIQSVEISKALEYPGVRTVLVGTDLIDMVVPQPVGWEHIDNQRPGPTYAMAIDRVRYTGQIVAAVVAGSRAQAEDAAERVMVEYDPLPAIMTIEQAMAPDTEPLVPGWTDNVFGSQTYEAGDVDQAFLEADIHVSENLYFGRQFGCPLETRGCVADWDRGSGRLEVWANSQSPNRLREVIAEVLDLSVADIRVRVPAIGGGFGSKANYYGEEILCCVLSRITGRPVKYIEDRRESFFATSHAREQRLHVELAAMNDGTIRGLRAEVIGVLGGEISSVGMGPVWLSAVSMPGPYRIPNASVTVTGVMTNRTPYGSYRGWGTPLAAFAMERMIERLARELSLDSLALRRKNYVRSDELPYHNGIFATLDSGDFEGALDRCEARLREDGWITFKEDARKSGRRVGIGYASFVEATGVGPSRVMSNLGIGQGGYDEAVVRMDSTGRVTVYTGQAEMGQGMSTTLAQLAAEELGIPSEEIRVVSGDTDACPYTGYGTGGSRALPVGGAAVAGAARELRTKILGIAASRLEADPNDLEIVKDAVQVRGVPDAGVPLRDVAHTAYRRLTDMPEGTEPTLQGRYIYDPPALTYANGCAAAVVEVDGGTGAVQVLGYVIADDCGTVVNPQIVEGQLHGATAQAIGGALLEELVYGDDGQLRTTTFVDYQLPSSVEIPRIATEHLEHPSPHTPGGMKGVGEAGTIPAAPAIAAAVEDALADPRVFIRSMPIHPEQVHSWVAG